MLVTLALSPHTAAAASALGPSTGGFFISSSKKDPSADLITASCSPRCYSRYALLCTEPTLTFMSVGDVGLHAEIYVLTLLEIELSTIIAAKEEIETTLD